MGNSIFQEAFQRLNMLNEETFNIDGNEVNDLEDFVDADAEDDTEVIDVIDDEAETEEDLQESYIDKVILDCVVCHSKIFKDPEAVSLNEDETLANEGEECPYCYSPDGFKILGQVKPYSKTEYDVDIEPKDDIGADDDLVVDDEIEDEDKAKVESLHRKSTGRRKIYESADKRKTERMQRVHARVQEKLNEACKNEEIEDDFEVDDAVEEGLAGAAVGAAIGAAAGHPVAGAMAGNKISNALSDSQDECLDEAEHPNLANKRGSVTKVLEDNLQLWANTDSLPKLKSVVNELLKGMTAPGAKKVLYNLAKQKNLQNGINYLTNVMMSGENMGMSQFNPNSKLYRESKDIKEGLQNIDLETDHDNIHISAEEKAEAGEEMIAPLEDDVRTDIEGGDDLDIMPEDDLGGMDDLDMEEPNPEDLVPLEDEGEEVPEGEEDFEDVDLDDFDEDTFDEYGESFLRNVYGNVDSFNTSKVKTSGNNLMVEGKITFKNGHTKPTRFVFEAVDIDRHGTMRFVGLNEQFAKNKNAFTITGRAIKNKFFTESFKYNFLINESGKTSRVHGMLTESSLRK